MKFNELVLIIYLVKKIISDTLLLFTKKLFVSICHAIVLAMLKFHWFILAADLHKQVRNFYFHFKRVC